MPAFSYTARTETGDLRRGEVEAGSRMEAARQIQAHGLFALELKRRYKWHFAFYRAANRRYCMIFCREIALMLSAGLSASESLRILAEGAPGGRAALLKDMAERMEMGASLADAMARHGEVFPAVIVSLVRAGEVGGSLGTMLEKLADQTEKSWRVREKLRTALVYPAFLATAAAFALGFIFLFVLPNFVRLFEGLVVELPLPTRLVLGIGSLFEEHGLLLLALLPVSAAAWLLLRQREDWRLRVDAFVLHLPLWGRLRLDLELMTLFDTLAVLLESGIPLHEALAVSGGVTQNRFLSALFSTMKKEVERGGALGAAVGLNVVFPPLVLELLRVGERTGELSAMLAKAADFCRFTGEMRAERLEAMIEPLMVLLLGAVVALVVLSVALPMFEMIGAYGY